MSTRHCGLSSLDQDAVEELPAALIQPSPATTPTNKQKNNEQPHNLEGNLSATLMPHDRIVSPGCNDSNGQQQQLINARPNPTPPDGHFEQVNLYLPVFFSIFNSNYICKAKTAKSKSAL